MGFFDFLDHYYFKSKDAEQLYHQFKTQYQSIVCPADPKQQNFKAIDVFTTSAVHQRCLTHWKKYFQSIPENVVMYDVLMNDKQLTSESLLAFLKVMSSKTDGGVQKFPIQKLDLSNCCFTTTDRKQSKDHHFVSAADENTARDAEQSFFSLLAEHLRESKTLVYLNLSYSSISVDTLRIILINGLRYNDSVQQLVMDDCHLPNNDLNVVNIFAGVLLPLGDKKKFLPPLHPLAHSEYRNSSLRKISIIDNQWSAEVVQKWEQLVKVCPKITSLQLVTAEGTNQPSEQLKKCLERNEVLQGIMDDVVKSLYKRQFKTKLNTFRESVKTYKMKGKNLAMLNEQGPAYKWMAQSDQDHRNDPFHPQVTASARWKSGYAISVGRRAEMQDVLAMRGKFVERKQDQTGSESAEQQQQAQVSAQYEDFWGVFDGHGGREAASYASENLPVLISERIKALPSVATPETRAEEIKKAFQDCQKQMAPWNTITGTTCVALYIHDNIRYSINLGDSRMVVHNIKTDKTQLLTRDHRPNEPEEQKRVLSLHGAFIEQGRVNGKCQVTRSLGDSDMSSYISCIPDVTWAPIDADDGFVILGSDGLWDVFAGEGDDVAERHSIVHKDNAAKWQKGLKEVTSIVLNQNSASAAAKKLCELAYQRGSTDNISAIVVYLHFNPRRDKDNKVAASTANLNAVQQPNTTQKQKNTNAPQVAEVLKSQASLAPQQKTQVPTNVPQSNHNLTSQGDLSKAQGPQTSDVDLNQNFNKTATKVANPLFRANSVKMKKAEQAVANMKK
ncbi:hypothetical protein MIR68_002370 [Amoeboaphelidium protococcarum]|nr:hypothetical protein MIR68_002370 [Amoeboaphelidium protococcarum]